jgi:hypothetical protein
VVLSSSLSAYTGEVTLFIEIVDYSIAVYSITHYKSHDVMHSLLSTAGGSSSSSSRSSSSCGSSSNNAVELTPVVESSFGDIVFGKQRDSSSTAWPAIVWDVRFCR